MNETKLKKLFEAVRREPAPVPADDFVTGVLRAIHRQPLSGTVSVLDQLALLFPRLAFAAVVLIGGCVAGDFLLTTLHLPGVNEGLAQLSDQWLLVGNGI